MIHYTDGNLLVILILIFILFILIFTNYKEEVNLVGFYPYK
jgi:hypothetical protein